MTQYSCKMLGSISSKYYRPIAEGRFNGFHPDETVKSFGKKYLEMHSRFKSKNLLLPIILADAISLFFSEKQWERLFMIKMWELLFIYSNEANTPPTDNSDPNYPNRFFKEDGPIPIHDTTGVFGFAVTMMKRDQRKGIPYRWTDDWYRYALLAMRVLNVPPQFHFDANKRNEHAQPDQSDFVKGQWKTCGSLLPSVFNVPGITGPQHPWDKDQAGCCDCDAHTVVFAFIAVAQATPHTYMIEGGLHAGTIPRKNIAKEVRRLTSQEFSYESFWRLLSQQSVQRPGCWDSSNNWAMKKLGVWDEMSSDRRFHYSFKKIELIKDETNAFHKDRNILLAKSRSDRAIEARNQLVDDNRNVEKKPKVEIYLSDDDDIIEVQHISSALVDDNQNVEKKPKVEIYLSDDDDIIEVKHLSSGSGRGLAKKRKRKVNAEAGGSRGYGTKEGAEDSRNEIKSEGVFIEMKPIKRERLDSDEQVPTKKVKVEVE